MNQKRIPSLDSLRFLFAMGIVLFHVNEFFAHYGENTLGLIYDFGGAVGNYFFFMSSGMLAAYLYREKLSDGKIDLKTWIIKRMYKIYPLFLCGEALMIAVEIWKKGLIGITYKKIVIDLCLVTSGWVYGGGEGPYDGPAWFLCVLLLCYIFYYFVCRLCKNKEAYICALVVFVLLGIYLEHQALEIPFGYRINGEGYAHFFLGCLLYHIYEDYLVYKKKWCKILAPIILGLMIWGTYCTSYNIIWGNDKVTVLTILVILFVYCAVELKPLRYLLELKPMKILGSLSMQIFLLHMPFLHLYLKIYSLTGSSTWSNFKKYAVYLVLMMLFCFAAHYLEKMLRNYLRLRKLGSDNEKN